jgi:hypothetical protein
MPCRVVFEAFGFVDPTLGGSEVALPDELLGLVLLVRCLWGDMVAEVVASLELPALEFEPTHPARVPTNAHHATCRSVLFKVIAAPVQ